jgi:hypothetical protein
MTCLENTTLATLQIVASTNVLLKSTASEAAEK